MHPVYHPSIFLIQSAKYTSVNDITKKFVKSILAQKIAYTSIYDSTMSHKQFEIKNKELRSLYRLKIDSYQLCL